MNGPTPTPGPDDKKDFSTRCRLAQECLPDAEYRRMLTALHDDMLAALRKSALLVAGAVGTLPDPEIAAPPAGQALTLDERIDAAIEAQLAAAQPTPDPDVYCVAEVAHRGTVLVSTRPDERPLQVKAGDLVTLQPAQPAPVAPAAPTHLTTSAVIAWLEGRAANTDTDPRWLAAQELRRLPSAGDRQTAGVTENGNG